MRHFKSSKRVESNITLNKKHTELECYKCGNIVRVDSEAIRVLCSICVCQLAPIEKNTKEKSNKPPGWKILPVYVHNDGTVYYRGIEQPELNGTLEPTNVENIINNIKKTKKNNKKHKIKNKEKKENELIEEHKLRVKEKNKNKLLKNKKISELL